MRRRKRDSYPGPWLPEPLLTPAQPPDEEAELAQNLSLGLVLMLERLSPAERAVFVLREGFDLSFAEIAELLDRKEDACRQRFRRARQHLRAGDTVEKVEVAGPGLVSEQESLLKALLEAVNRQDVDALVGLFSRDVVVYTDGGGVVSAAIRPVTDPERIATVILHLTRKTDARGGLTYEHAQLNYGAGLIVRQQGAVHSTLQLEVSDGLISKLFVMRNPNKLGHLDGNPVRRKQGPAGKPG